MSDKVTLKVDNWTVKTENRGKGKMKFTIKLGKEDAEAFKSWSEAVRPPEIPDENFYKTIFFKGIEYLNLQLAELARQSLEQQKQEEAMMITENQLEVSKSLSPTSQLKLVPPTDTNE